MSATTAATRTVCTLAPSLADAGQVAQWRQHMRESDRLTCADGNEVRRAVCRLLLHIMRVAAHLRSQALGSLRSGHVAGQFVKRLRRKT